jgi:hypothetical protein
MSKFPLATVARVRRIRTNLARTAVARDKTVEQLARDGHALAIASLAERPAFDALTESMDSNGFRAAAYLGLGLAGDVRRTGTEVEQAQDQVQASLESWKGARTDEEVVDLLEASYLAAKAAEVAAAEQRAADDRSAARWFARRSGGAA